MAAKDFSIANKLEVLPGNILSLPGCEPTSAASSPTLDMNMKCCASHISLELAMRTIPEAQIVFMQNFGCMGPRKFLVLPGGPPPQVGCTPSPDGTEACKPDWYQMLRDAACQEEPQKQCTQACGDISGFKYDGYCGCEKDEQG
jgi:hypothetical protein